MMQLTGWGFKSLLVFAMTMPMLVLFSVSSLGPHIVESLAIEPGSLGYLITSAFGVAALLSIWAGAYVNRYGARHSLILLFSLVAIAFFLVAIQPSYFTLAIAAGLCGVSQALANPATNVLIAKNFPPHKKAGVVGLKQAGVQLAALISGLLLPILAFTFGWHWAYASLVPICLLFLFFSFRLTKHTPVAGRFKIESPNKILLRLMGVQFFVGVGLSAFVTFLPSYSTFLGVDKQLASYLIGIFGLVGMLSRTLLTPFAARFSDESYLLLILIGISALAVLCMNLFSHYEWVVWLAAIAVGATAVTTNAVAMSMAVKDTSFGKLASASGYISVAFFGGYALGPAGFGYLINSQQEYSAAWNTVCIAFLFATLFTIALIYTRRRARNTELVY